MIQKIDHSVQELKVPEAIKNTPVDEQETTINICRDDKFAYIYTCDNTMLTKLRRVQAKNPEAYVVTRVFYCNDEISGVEVRVPKRLISFRSGIKTEKGGDEVEVDVDELGELLNEEGNQPSFFIWMKVKPPVSSDQKKRSVRRHKKRACTK